MDLGFVVVRFETEPNACAGIVGSVLLGCVFVLPLFSRGGNGCT